MPEDLHARLKERAIRNNRSLTQELITGLIDWDESTENSANALKQTKKRMKNTGRQIDRLRKKMTCYLSAKEIDLAVCEGRK